MAPINFLAIRISCRDALLIPPISPRESNIDTREVDTVSEVRKLYTMVSQADNDALESQFESQFQKPGDLVERDDDTGLMEVESLCMSMDLPHCTPRASTN